MDILQVLVKGRLSGEIITLECSRRGWWLFYDEYLKDMDGAAFSPEGMCDPGTAIDFPLYKDLPQAELKSLRYDLQGRSIAMRLIMHIAGVVF